MNYNYLHTNITSSHPEMFCEKGILKNFEKVTAGLSLATLLKKRLWHRCFPMDFAK